MPDRPQTVIEVNGLTRSFRTFRKAPGLAGAVRGLFRRQHETLYAVREISFRIAEGELVGFLGPNGAGKTTTLKMLAGLLYPTSGEARVLGYVPWERKDGYRRQFALLLGHKNQLWWDLPARESFELNARIYGIAHDRMQRTVDEMTERLDVRHKLGVMVRELSLGERMKMELIAALLHEPRVLCLDEPTLGLDVVSQKAVRDFLRHYNATRRVTVLLTSHYMADIQELCRRVLIIDHGRLFFDGELEEILDRSADYKRVTLHTDPAAPHPDADLSLYGKVVEHSPVTVQLEVKRDRVIAVCKALLDRFSVLDIDIQEVPIEEVIRRLFTPTAARSDPHASPTPGIPPQSE
jgi:ABC-2 type transport system ATP-binding protein